MTNLQFRYLSSVTKAGIPEFVGFVGAWIVAIGLAVLQMYWHDCVSKMLMRCTVIECE